VRAFRQVPARGVTVALVCTLAVSGCAQFNKALGQQQVDVYFASNVSVAFKMKVRTACNNPPDVKAEPIAKGVPLSSAVDIVVYNTTGASLADVARLEECINKFAPKTIGFDPVDSSDNQ
jgi:hypothetical protein